MTERRTRSEIRTRDRELRQDTENRIEDVREEQRQVEALKEALDTQEDPHLQETAEALNRVAGEAEATARRALDEARRSVEEAVEAEHEEVSEPADAGQAGERLAAGQLEAARSRADRFARELERAMEERDDAARFLEEIARASSEHQERSREQTDDTVRAATAAAEALRRF